MNVFCTCYTPVKSLRFHLCVGSADSEINEEQKKEKLSELRKKEKDIQDVLSQRMAELKKICLREAVRTRRMEKDQKIPDSEMYIST